MSSHEMFLYALDSVTSYTGPGSLFPNASLGNLSVGGTVTFGDLAGEKITVNDDDSYLEDGDTGILGIGGQTSTSSGSLFNLTGSTETEYSYVLTDPGTGDTIRIYAFTSSGLLGLSNNVVGFVADGEIDPNITYLIAYDHSAPSVPYSSLVICFAAGTRIATGLRTAVRVEDLRGGDRILTVDHGLQPIRWIGLRHIGRTELSDTPGLRPVRVSAGALGNGLPVDDLIVSPQHRILVRSAIAQTMFNTHEVLVAAKQLVGVDGITTADDLTQISYFHFLCDAHEIVFANGAETESLFAGPQTLKALSERALAEVASIFPDLNDATGGPPSCRVQASGRQGRRLAQRHLKNQKPLVSCHRQDGRATVAQNAIRQPSA
ncbi:Hint domain-containing protein [Pseudosulfitobacter pseudonitzschiae]|nr:Hint domain-containing protein [Pseudosulfitobacter pseudonitzschiae]MCD2313720.1 Hint domain-containing protein [Pseudosulfitobacter pseudonitzschiae]